MFLEIFSVLIRPLFSFIVDMKQTLQQFRHCAEARILCPDLLNIRYFAQNVKCLIHLSDNSYNTSQQDALFLNFIW